MYQVINEQELSEIFTYLDDVKDYINDALHLVDGRNKLCFIHTAHCFEMGAKYDYLYFIIREMGLFKIAQNTSDKGT